MSCHSKHSDEGSVSLGSQEEQRPAEVIAQLQLLLSATSEELEQQRRLNHALIKRKVYRTFNEILITAMTLYTELQGQSNQVKDLQELLMLPTFTYNNV